MRSGIKCKASELVRDGRIPSLLVLPEEADPPQPQERPYVPDDVEGKAPFDISPDITPTTAPVLSAAADITQTFIEVSWTAAEFEAGPRVASYTLYRDSGDGFVVIDTIVVEYDMLGGITGPDLEYTDIEVEEGETYTYRVIASGDPFGSARSNTVAVTMPGPIDAPVLTATLDMTTVDLSWTNLQNGDADTFLLYRAELTGGEPGPYTLIFSGYAFAYEDNPSAAEYRYYVVGQLGGIDFPSNLEDVNVPAAPTAPVLSGEQNAGDIDLSWTESIPTGGTIVGYRLYKSVDGGDFTLLVDQAGLTYTDTDTPDGHTYTYYVIGYDTNGFDSPDSNLVTINIGAAIEVITESRTWTKPEGLIEVEIMVVGGGGGGASGGGRLAFIPRSGGGGEGGGISFATFAAGDLTDTVVVTIGAGGEGGAATTGQQFGTTGSNGGATSFGAYLTAGGGDAGQGDADGGAGGGAGTTEGGGNGGDGAATGGGATTSAGADTALSGSGGGGGGATQTEKPGREGGTVANGGSPLVGGIAGVAVPDDTTPGAIAIGEDGGPGTDNLDYTSAGSGGGGGARAIASNGEGFGGAGGEGGFPGGGGGGGGIGLGDSSPESHGGAGGRGGNGVVVLRYTYAP
jgi:fibronectin type 3 domain-containing protein